MKQSNDTNFNYIGVEVSSKPNTLMNEKCSTARMELQHFSWKLQIMTAVLSTIFRLRNFFRQHWMEFPAWLAPKLHLRSWCHVRDRRHKSFQSIYRYQWRNDKLEYCFWKCLLRRAKYEVRCDQLFFLEWQLLVCWNSYLENSGWKRPGSKSGLTKENPRNSSWLIEMSTSCFTGVNVGSSLVNSESKFSTSFLLFWKLNKLLRLTSSAKETRVWRNFKNGLPDRVKYSLGATTIHVSEYLQT